jgi:hypothetical protein
MADGSTKPIKDVKVGDRVASADPSSGASRSEPVTKLHDDQDTQLTDVTVRTPDGHTQVIHTTQEHPFWDASTGSWVDAAHLKPGDQLLSTGGQVVTVAGVHSWTGSHDMRNLTVRDLHTFYVMTGATPVLVHNDGGGLGDNITLYQDYTARVDMFNVRGQASFEIHVYFRGTEIGIFGSNGFFNKHGINAADVSVPDQVNNRLKGIAIELMRRNGQLGPNDDIKGDAWKRPMIGSSGC